MVNVGNIPYMDSMGIIFGFPKHLRSDIGSRLAAAGKRPVKREGVSERRERQWPETPGNLGENGSLKQEGNDGNALSSTVVLFPRI